MGLPHASRHTQVKSTGGCWNAGGIQLATWAGPRSISIGEVLSDSARSCNANATRFSHPLSSRPAIPHSSDSLRLEMAAAAVRTAHRVDRQHFAGAVPYRRVAA